MLGTPTPDEIAAIPNPQTRDFLRSQAKRKPRPLETLFKDASAPALDLLDKLLKFDPSKRITIEEALNHPYLTELHYPSDEVSLGLDITPSLQESPSHNLTLSSRSTPSPPPNSRLSSMMRFSFTTLRTSGKNMRSSNTSSLKECWRPKESAS